VVVGECVVAVGEGLGRHRTMPELNERRCMDKWLWHALGEKMHLSRHVA
jgi:hypothetical protein